MSEAPTSLPPPEVWKAVEKAEAQKRSDADLLRLSRPLTRVGGTLLFLFIFLWWAHSGGMFILANSTWSDALVDAEALLLGVLVVLFGINVIHGLRVHRRLAAEFARIEALEGPEGTFLLVPVEKPATPGEERPVYARTGTRDLGQYELRPVPRSSPTGTRALSVEEAP